MSKNLQLIIGILIFILTVGVIGYWYILTGPTQAEIAAKEKQIEIVDRNILRSAVVEELKKLDVNGQIPVQVDKQEVGKDDLFAR